ncbi:sulfurtransferase [Spiribacter halobius]|uniref:Sulfurtransferase n=1 Tax=Sediminicurvatus halobius TaxID=2182432 RepID=A0A2U2N9X5_9GAMM|nr:sulfurtransferase [Spiribacter halobius]PWG65759.1 sulfurtransferase [Spiribacter halobius]UEX77796.1 sulfurtransferase [Spiribacter halobius]
MNRFTRLVGSAVLTAGLAPALAAAGPAVTPLVDTGWLQSNLDAEDLVVLDVRSAIDGSDRSDFERAHIPGAVYSSYTGGGWRVTENGVPGKLPPVEDLEALIGGLGIDNDDTVVIVPAGSGSTDFGSAARVYWTFKVLGHDDVAILNGGHRAWVQADGALETGPVEAVGTSFEADFRPELLATTEEVEAALEADHQLVDARPAPQYEGEAKHPAARSAGTIPGAASLEERLLVQEGTAQFVDRERVFELVEVAGIRTDERIVTFCNTGHWAATAWFALSEVAGYEDVAMYDGSMTEWTQDESRPLALAQRALSRLLEGFGG